MKVINQDQPAEAQTAEEKLEPSPKRQPQHGIATLLQGERFAVCEGLYEDGEGGLHCFLKATEPYCLNIKAGRRVAGWQPVKDDTADWNKQALESCQRQVRAWRDHADAVVL